MFKFKCQFNCWVGAVLLKNDMFFTLNCKSSQLSVKCVCCWSREVDDQAHVLLERLIISSNRWIRENERFYNGFCTIVVHKSIEKIRSFLSIQLSVKIVILCKSPQNEVFVIIFQLNLLVSLIASGYFEPSLLSCYLCYN